MIFRLYFIASMNYFWNNIYLSIFFFLYKYKLKLFIFICIAYYNLSIHILHKCVMMFSYYIKHIIQQTHKNIVHMLLLFLNYI